MKKIQNTVFMILVLFFATTAFADMQEKRKEIIQKAIDMYIIQKLDVYGNVSRLWVKPLFYGLSYDEKLALVHVVYAYCLKMNSRYRTVILYDDFSKEEVGIYGAGAGYDGLSSADYGALKMY